MPWTCEACTLDHADDVPTCSGCGMTKEAWTLHIDRTRTLVVSRKQRFEVFRGVVAEALPPDEARRRLGELVEPTVAPTMAKQEARRLAEQGLWPRLDRLLVVRVKPGEKSPTVTLCADFTRSPQLEVEVAPEVERDGVFDVLFLLVHGPEDVSGISFPGVEVVDVSEAGEPGVALSVEIEALGREPVELPIETAATPTVGLLEVEDICFATGREILFPGGWSRSDEITGLAVIAAALERARKHPEQRLLIAGHTDTRGSVKDNLVLSQDRATNVHLYLTGQRQAWAEHCQQNFEAADVQSVLKWADFRFEWGCDPGPIDGVWGSGSKKARDAFRARYNEEYDGSLEAGARQSEADWAAFFDLYEAALAEKLTTTPDRLAGLRAQVRLCEPATLACSEHWPTARPGAPDGLAADRRVDVLFFDDDEVPSLPGEPPGAPIYGEGRFTRDYMTVDDALTEPEPPYGDAPFAEVCRYAQSHSV